MGRKLPFVLVLCILCTGPVGLWAQQNAFKWTFSKFDKDQSGEVTFREFKCHAFFRFDRNRNMKLNRFEFWRLKQNQKRALRRFERTIRKGFYPKYYISAMRPNHQLHVSKDGIAELSR